jgi:hypothetical protein
MKVREQRELIYLGEGSHSEMTKLHAVLARGGIRADILPVRSCSTHT